MLTLLIDGDIVAYNYASAAERTVTFGEGNVATIIDHDYDPYTKAIDCIEGYAEYLQADEIIVCLSDPKKNFRKVVLPSYKGTRKAKPSLLMAVKDHMAATYRTYQKDWLEADDVMGILATHPTLIKGDKVIVTIDKDLKQIEGLAFNPDKDTYVRNISYAEGYRFFMYQTLVGDTVDEYKGCVGIGATKAPRILDAAEQRATTEGIPLEVAYWEAVVKAYESKGQTEADALVQARVARMSTYKDFDFKTGKVILWNPPKK